MVDDTCDSALLDCLFIRDPLSTAPFSTGLFCGCPGEVRVCVCVCVCARARAHACMCVDG